MNKTAEEKKLDKLVDLALAAENLLRDRAEESLDNVREELMKHYDNPIIPDTTVSLLKVIEDEHGLPIRLIPYWHRRFEIIRNKHGIGAASEIIMLVLEYYVSDYVDIINDLSSDDFTHAEISNMFDYIVDEIDKIPVDRFNDYQSITRDCNLFFNTEKMFNDFLEIWKKWDDNIDALI